jgi:hypothetical protein
MPEGLPPYVLVARIGSILAMSFALALGFLFLLAGWWLISLAAFGCFVPAFALMAFVERHAGTSGSSGTSRS